MFRPHGSPENQVVTDRLVRTELPVIFLLLPPELGILPDESLRTNFHTLQEGKTAQGIASVGHSISKA